MTKRSLALVSILALAATSSLAQAHGNPRGEAKATVSGKSVVIDYGRPSLKGRDMLGQAPIGTAWRMGADAATTLKTEADLSFGDVKVPKGEYVLTATRVAEDRWTLNLKKGTDAVADVPLAGEKVKASVELFTIELQADKDKGEFKMTWGETALKASFSGK